jgi:beta-lactam-binding protein with PASTA domain
MWFLYVVVCTAGLLQYGCGYARLESVTINSRLARKGEPLTVEVVREGEQVTSKLAMGLKKGDEIKTPAGVKAFIGFSDGSEIIMMPETHITIETIRVWFGTIIASVKRKFKVKTKHVTAGVKGTNFLMQMGKDDRSRVVMIEGSVVLTSNENRWSPVLLQSGQQASIQGTMSPQRSRMPQKDYDQLIKGLNDLERLRGKKAKVFVPRVVGLQEGMALEMLRSAGLKITDIKRTIEGDYPIGSIVLQEPGPGERVKSGSRVTVRVRARAVTVPHVIGQHRSGAMDAIQRAGLSVHRDVPEKITGQYEAGVVIAQSPPAGQRVMEGTAVKLTVEAKSTEVPNVTGISVEQAEMSIRERGLAVRTRPSGPREGIEVPQVVGQDPTPGRRVKPGTTVTLNVANPGVRIPNLIRQSEDAARKSLAGANLRVGNVSRQWSTQYPANVVMSQSPQTGQVVERNSTVALTVSKGRRPEARVPNIIGRHEREAPRLLSQANLRVGYITRQNHEKYPAGVVIDQSPRDGRVVEPGSTVNLTVSEGPPQTRVPSLIGRYEKEAINLLSQANLRVGNITKRESGRYRAGIVMEQSITAGQPVRPGSAVNLTVSKGLQ